MALLTCFQVLVIQIPVSVIATKLLFPEIAFLFIRRCIERFIALKNSLLQYLNEFNKWSSARGKGIYMALLHAFRFSSSKSLPHKSLRNSAFQK
jgi:hypothetical protein